MGGSIKRNLARYHGVFAPNHRWRALIVPAQRGRGGSAAAGQGSTPPKHVAMTWAQRLKRVFGIQINPCERCGGAVKIIACIENPEFVGRILSHLGLDRPDLDGTRTALRAAAESLCATPPPFRPLPVRAARVPVPPPRHGPAE